LLSACRIVQNIAFHAFSDCPASERKPVPATLKERQQKAADDKRAKEAEQRNRKLQRAKRKGIELKEEAGPRKHGKNKSSGGGEEKEGLDKEEITTFDD
jgi:hypothetical protein